MARSEDAVAPIYDGADWTEMDINAGRRSPQQRICPLIVLALRRGSRLDMVRMRWGTDNATSGSGADMGGAHIRAHDRRYHPVPDRLLHD
jgi:hypothetical protein